MVYNMYNKLNVCKHALISMCKEVEYVNTCVELYVLRLNKLNVCTRVLHLYSTCKQVDI